MPNLKAAKDTSLDKFLEGSVHVALSLFITVYKFLHTKEGPPWACWDFSCSFAVFVVSNDHPFAEKFAWQSIVVLDHAAMDCCLSI